MLSVCIPSYNTADYLRDCLDSVISQKVDEQFEIIVADDASTDASREILDEYKQKLGDRLKLIFQKENTRDKCYRNHLDVYEASEGGYIYRHDSDDIMLPGRLQKQLDAIKSRKDIAIVYGNGRAFDSDTGKTLYYFNENYYNFKKIPELSSLKHLVMYANYFLTPASMYRKGALDTGELKELFCQLTHYFDLALHASAASRGKILRINEVVTDYRVHSGSVCAKVRNNEQKRIEANKSFSRIIDFTKRYGIGGEVAEIARAGNDFATALFFLKAGNKLLFQKYMESSGNHGQFFDDRHEYLYNMKDVPDMVLDFLKQE